MQVALCNSRSKALPSHYSIGLEVRGAFETFACPQGKDANQWQCQILYNCHMQYPQLGEVECNIDRLATYGNRHIFSEYICNICDAKLLCIFQVAFTWLEIPVARSTQ